jgi:hypothetical protein
MFVIKWVAHGHEAEPIEVEKSDLKDVGLLVLRCQGRLSEMRRRHTPKSPDGFLVFDSDGNEIRRWFGSPRSDA